MTELQRVEGGYVDVGPATALPPGSTLAVEIDGEAVGLYNVSGDIYAGGTVTFDGGATTVLGDILAAGTGTSKINSSIGSANADDPLSTVHVNGALDLLWSGARAHTNVIANGSVTVNSRVIEGDVPLPTGSSPSVNGGRIECFSAWVSAPELQAIKARHPAVQHTVYQHTFAGLEDGDQFIQFCGELNLDRDVCREQHTFYRHAISVGVEIRHVTFGDLLNDRLELETARRETRDQLFAVCGVDLSIRQFPGEFH